MNGPHNGIGWCDYTWNPVTGCKFGCRFGGASCYAEAITHRFGGAHWPNGFAPTFHPERLDEPCKLKTPSRIFTVSMGDLFGSWVPPEWITSVLDACRQAPWHTFILLTKAPWNAVTWAMPDNVWLGTTITGGLPGEARRLACVRDYRARVRFLSCEPLAGPVDVSVADPDWIIVGGAAGPGAFQPNEAWVRAVEDYADGRGVPVYHKDNLSVRPVKRREWPTAAGVMNRTLNASVGVKFQPAERAPVTSDTRQRGIKRSEP
jgi:protein gp37